MINIYLWATPGRADPEFVERFQWVATVSWGGGPAGRLTSGRTFRRVVESMKYARVTKVVYIYVCSLSTHIYTPYPLSILSVLSAFKT